MGSLLRDLMCRAERQLRHGREEGDAVSRKPARNLLQCGQRRSHGEMLRARTKATGDGVKRYFVDRSF